MGTPTTAFDLLERIRRGDRDAFTLLVERYRRRLAILIQTRLGPELRGEVEVDDVFQETLLRAYRDLDHFEYRTPGSFLRWLASIAGHVIVDLARYQGRDRRAGEVVPFRSASNPLGPEPADTVTPSRIFAQDERVRTVLNRLEALPPDYREVILLAKFEGLETAEVAERMGKSREAVALLLHRALKRLRELSGARA